MRRIWRVAPPLGLAFACLVAMAQPAAAQDRTRTLEVYSRLTIVDVTATDAAGNPIFGLTKSDFKIFEDGKQQVIRNFEEVSAKPLRSRPPLPPGIYTNLQLDSPSPAINIILLDFLNMAPVDSTAPGAEANAVAMQHRVKQAAIQAVQQMPAGTRVAILLLNNDLRILQNFTSDRVLLTAAINAAPYDTDGNGDPHCTQSNSRNQSVLEALDRIAVDTEGIKLRKNLIWFTVGIPAITQPEARPACLPDYATGLTHAYDLLTASQVSIYPISAEGIGDLGPATFSMEDVARATGGVAFSESNDMTPAVLKSLDHGANYYSISYVPPARNYDGTYHKIEVKVNRPGITLVFRSGYYADDVNKLAKMPPGLTFSMMPPTATAGNMKAPMSRGMPLSQQLLFDVGVEPDNTPRKPGTPALLGTLDAKLRAKPLTRYRFSYSVPLQQFTFTNGPKENHLANLEFDISVFDVDGHRLTGLSQIVKANLSDATYQQDLTEGQPIRFTQQIDLPPGQLFVRVGVLDRSTDKYGTLELPLKIAK